jgi:hypothetical protein
LVGFDFDIYLNKFVKKLPEGMMMVVDNEVLMN